MEHEFRERKLKAAQYEKKMKRARLVYGVGFNDADYVVAYEAKDGETGKIIQVTCPIYAKWKSMLKRCYSKAFHERHPTYTDCTVGEDLKTFTTFRMWLEQQDGWEELELDKDLKIRFNKHYAQGTCLLIPKALNNALLDSAGSRGKYLIGVHYLKGNLNKPYLAGISKGKGREHLGSFATELGAHNAWVTARIGWLDDLKVEHPEFAQYLDQHKPEHQCQQLALDT